MLVLKDSSPYRAKFQVLIGKITTRIIYKEWYEERNKGLNPHAIGGIESAKCCGAGGGEGGSSLGTANMTQKALFIVEIGIDVYALFIVEIASDSAVERWWARLDIFFFF